MKVHPAAALFPMLPDEELAALAEDIRQHGQIEPIITHEGLILDGRNRYAACERAGFAPKTVEWDGKDANGEECSPFSFVWSLNGERRQLEAGQRGAIYLKIRRADESWAAERDRLRQQADKARATAQAGNKNAAKQSQTTLSATVCDPEPAKPRGENKTRKRVAEESRVSMGTAQALLEVESKRPELLDRVAAGDMTLPQAKREIKRDAVVAKLEEVAAREIVAPPENRRYSVLVLDPPWPIEKIERDCRPNQVELDYPTMSLDEIKALDVPGRLHDDAHVWLWTTHRFLPDSFALLSAWGLKYVCTFVWHKPGGFQPVGLPQFNCEFALYARKGSPMFLDTKALPVCSSWPRGAHSEKPEAFYELLRRVTGGLRLDWFNRRAIDGFDVCGKEAARG